MFKYCDEDGEVNMEHNPNGSLKNIAAFAIRKEMFWNDASPERACDKI